MIISYKIDTASAEDIYSHIKSSSGMFTPPLDTRVNLGDYAQKLFDKSVTFEAWADGKVAGLVAAYFNDPENITGFISHVCTLTEYAGKGIATHLFNMCLNHAVKTGFSEIRLDVHCDNKVAIKLYEKFNFYTYSRNMEKLMMKCNVV